MSINLSCYYIEKFQSKIGKELTFRDECRLWQTKGHDAYEILSVAKQGNQAIFDKYCEWLKTQPGSDSIFETYSDEDKIQIFFNGQPKENFTPIKTCTRYDEEVEQCQKFFEKYGGIDNVEFCAD